MEKKKNNATYIWIYIFLGIALIIFTAYNVAQGASFNSKYNEKLSRTREAAKPALIEIITIGNAECQDCFDISPILDSIKRGNVNITSEKALDLKSGEGKELIRKYAIEKLPAVIIRGEIGKVKTPGLDEKEGVLLFAEAAPPYTEPETGRIRGRVSAVIIRDSACSNCIDFSQMISALKQSGVVISSEKALEKNSAEGEELIAKHDLEILPALVLSPELREYGPDIVDKWESIGTEEQDGSFVTRKIAPPYVNLSTGKIEGLVEMIVIEDSGCGDCYDASAFNKPILKRLGIFLDKERSVDMSSQEGALLIKQYNIEKVPTIILRGDVDEYSYFASVWASVGSIEADRAYVFRQMEVVNQPYRDLATGKIVKPVAE